MSDPDSPTPPRDDEPGGAPETPDAGEPTEAMPTQPGPGEPTEAMPTQPGPGDETPPQGYPPSGADPDPAATEPTIQMPVAAAGTGAAAAAAATPSSTEYVLDDTQLPWYKRPAYLAMVGIAVVLGAALIAWLLFAGDDEPDPDEVSVRIQIVDDQGEPIDRSFTAEVTGPPGAEESFTWLQPTSTSAVSGGRTGSSGQIDFRWQPDDTVAVPATWESTIRITEFLPVGWMPPGSPIDCDLRRADGSGAAITMNVDVVPVDDADDATIDRVAGYSFPNQTFVPGDAAECEIVSTAPVETTTTTAAETTTTGQSTTTTAETTTTSTAPPVTEPPPTEPPPTQPPATDPPATEPPPTQPPATDPPATDPPATDPPVTDPPAPETALGVIESDPDLSELASLLTDRAPALAAELDDPDTEVTFFAPNNDAVLGAQLPADDTDLEELLRAHFHPSGSLSVADLVQLTEVEVDVGGPQPLSDADPPLVGSVGAQIVEQDLPVPAAGGIVQKINMVLEIEP